MRKALMLAVALFWGLSPVVAFDCSHLDASQIELCNMINSIDGTQEEKEALITLALYGNRVIPNHDFVAFWNTRLQVVEAPQGVSKQDEGIIKDAWIKILTVMPSVLEGNKFYCDKNGKVQSAYNYRIELPTDTASGDCRTDYSLERNSYSLNVYANDVFIGNEKITSFDISEGQTQFKAQLAIDAVTKIDHYQENRYCCRWRNGECRRHCTSCDYVSTETKTDNLQISDALNAEVEQEQPKGKFTILDRTRSIKGRVEASNFTRLTLDFNQSSYQKSLYVYDFVYSLPPYNIITLRAKPYIEKKSSNLYIESLNSSAFLFTVANANDCKLNLYTHFHQTVVPCNNLYEKKNISIKTDKRSYFVNETINVTLIPDNLIFNLTYGNTYILAQGNFSLLANPIYNRIVASYQEETAESLISVTKKDKLVLASQIIIFYLFNHLLFSYLTRSEWLLRWLNVGYST